MVRRALLIGCQTGALQGCKNSVAAMASALGAYDFRTKLCTGDQATRAGILARMEALINDTAPGDAALIYYTGHGGLVPCMEPAACGAGLVSPHLHQLLVPVDFDLDGPFRGILDIELAFVLARLTARTANVTTIFDCCHAEGVMRGPEAGRGRKTHGQSTEERAHAQIREHLAGWRERADNRPALDPESSPHAVKLAAATAERYAYEDLGRDGCHMGRLTRALCEALAAWHGQAVTWDAVYQIVAQRVRTRSDGRQHPQLDGPSHRLLFELGEAPVHGALAVDSDGHATYLLGGSLVGVRAGERYAILPLAAPRGSDPCGSALAAARVVEVAPDRARVVIEPAPAAPGVAAHVPNPRSLAGLRAVPLDERPRGWQAGHARGLESGTGDQALAIGFEVAWGRVRDGVREPAGQLEHASQREPAGQLEHASQREPAALLATWNVSPGDHIYLELRNRDRDTTTYWTVLDIDTDDAVRVWTRSARSGLSLAGCETYLLGARPHQRPRGLRIDAPAVPGSVRSLLILVSDRPHDLRPLETASPDAQHQATSTAPLLDAAAPTGPAMRSPRGALRHAVARIDLRICDDDPHP